MPNFRLKDYMICPPGNFWVSQTVDGNTFKVEESPLIKQVAYELLQWRKGNGYPDATFEAALDFTDCFTCTRLNNSIRYCFSTDKTVAQLHQELVKSGCRGCGVRHVE